ncbi:MAG TPA: hypothetical protein VMT75_11340 [Candidatus Saccharimonadales bacterium]|nr:hypothetical protein [Candidatus Saccharimonadales bacterium]
MSTPRAIIVRQPGIMRQAITISPPIMLMSPTAIIITQRITPLRPRSFTPNTTATRQSLLPANREHAASPRDCCGE